MVERPFLRTGERMAVCTLPINQSAAGLLILSSRGAFCDEESQPAHSQPHGEVNRWLDGNCDFSGTCVPSE